MRKIPHVGAPAPQFRLFDAQGRNVGRTDFSGTWLVVYFYPKDDTPGCTIEGIEFSARLGEFEKRHATVIGISPDSKESHKKFCEKNNLKHILLADKTKSTLKAYGAWGEKNLYGKISRGVLRSTFIISPEGKIAHVWPNVQAAGHANAVLEKLGELQGAK